MFERFTDRARRVIVLAQEEAAWELSHNHIGTEHILLGLIQEREGIAAKAIHRFGISLEAARRQVEHIIGPGQQVLSGQIPFTPRAKKALELSLREATRLSHDSIGTGHILLGLIREREGVAAQVLVKLEVDLNRLRQQVVQLLSADPSRTEGMDAAVVEEHLTYHEELGFPAEELVDARAGIFESEALDEIRALLRDIVKRLERIERQLGDNN